MGIFVSDWSIAAGQETVAFWPGGNGFSNLMISVLEDTSTRMGIAGLTSTVSFTPLAKVCPYCRMEMTTLSTGNSPVLVKSTE